MKIQIGYGVEKQYCFLVSKMNLHAWKAVIEDLHNIYLLFFFIILFYLDAMSNRGAKLKFQWYILGHQDVGGKTNCKTMLSKFKD
jgi:hypothetical protein